LREVGPRKIKMMGKNQFDEFSNAKFKNKSSNLPANQLNKLLGKLEENNYIDEI
jgi:hypothetical protein